MSRCSSNTMVAMSSIYTQNKFGKRDQDGQEMSIRIPRAMVVKRVPLRGGSETFARSPSPEMPRHDGVSDVRLFRFDQSTAPYPISLKFLVRRRNLQSSQVFND